MTTMTETKPPVLTGWHTVTEISRACGVSQGVVYNDTVTARTQGESWIQKKYSSAVGRSCWCINTDHALYRTLAARWTGLPFIPPHPDKNEDIDVLVGDDDELSLDDMGELEDCESRSSHGHSTTAQAVVQEIMSREPWPILRGWLLRHGLLVYTNALSEDDKYPIWYWKWGALSGKSYLSKADAICAALDARYPLVNHYWPSFDDDDDEIVPPPLPMTDDIATSTQPKKKFKLLLLLLIVILLFAFFVASGMQ